VWYCSQEFELGSGKKQRTEGAQIERPKVDVNVED